MAVRIVGVNLPDEKRIEYALTFIYGIGPSLAKRILKGVGLNANKKVKELSDLEIKNIQDFIEKEFTVEGDLKAEISENIKRLREIGSYRGYRHVRGLPVRGQRTRSNARTRRGRRRTVGALSKEAWAKIDQAETTKKQPQKLSKNK